jgi:hypothetical protein
MATFACGGVTYTSPVDAGADGPVASLDSLSEAGLCEGGPVDLQEGLVVRDPDGTSVQVDSSGVYFIGQPRGENNPQGPSNLYRAPKDLSSAQMLAADFGALLALDAQTVYGTTSSAAGVNVVAVAKTGGPVTTLASGLPSPHFSATPGGFESMTAGVDSLFIATGDVLFSIGKTGGAPHTLAKATDAYVFGADAEKVYWAAGGSDPAIHATVFASDVDTVLVQGGSAPALLVSSTIVYQQSGEVRSVAKAGGAPTALSTFGGPMMASDGTWVYVGFDFYDTGSPAIVRFPLRGGRAQDTGAQPTGGGLVRSFAVDGTSVYWASLVEEPLPWWSLSRLCN